MDKKIRVRAAFLGAPLNKLDEIIIGNEIYKKNAYRTVDVSVEVANIMKDGMKKGWFYVEELGSCTVDEDDNVVTWNPNPIIRKPVEAVEAAITEEVVENVENTVEDITEVAEATVETVVETEVEEVTAVTEETAEVIDFSAMKKAELIKYAEDNNIELPEGATATEIRNILSNK